MTDNNNLNPSIQELIGRITSIGLNFYSDNQCMVQVESAIDGIMRFTEVEIGDEMDPTFEHEIATGATTEWTGTFQDFLLIAFNGGVKQFAVSGIDPTDFIQILNSEDYKKLAISLVERVQEHGSGIQVGNGTGTASSFEEFGLHNGEIIPWDEVIDGQSE